MKKLLLLLTFLFILNIGYSQFKNLKDKVLGDKSPVANLVKKPPVISTNFDDDVKMEGSLPADFGNDKHIFHCIMPGVVPVGVLFYARVFMK